MFLNNLIFPKNISLGSGGGSSYQTEIATNSGGYTYRNQRWANPLYKFDVIYGLNHRDKVQQVVDIHHVAAGSANSFRFFDHMDNKSGDYDANITSLDQLLGTGDGVIVDFQLVKNYTNSGYTRTRTITKPFDTVLVAIDGIDQTIGVDFTIDLTTGIITFTSAPLLGEVVTAGFNFHVPVRFESDYLPIEIKTLEIIGSELVLVEDRAA